MSRTKRHKAFISYHHGLDEEWKDRFVRMMGARIIDKSIYVGEIVDTNSPTADTLRRIREEYISEATVAVVLIGPRTWQRKFVDWEIGAALRDTDMNRRCGLIGILLPTHPDFGKPTYNPSLIPPRLADNCSSDNPFAKIVDWRGTWRGRRYAGPYPRRLSEKKEATGPPTTADSPSGETGTGLLTKAGRLSLPCR